MIETLMGMEIVDEREQTLDMQVMAKEKWQARMASHDNLIHNKEESDDTDESSSNKPL